MAGMCYGVNSGGETETATPVEPSSESAMRRRMEIHQFRFVASNVTVSPAIETGRKRHKLEVFGKEIPKSERSRIMKRQRIEEVATSSLPRICENAVEESCNEDIHHVNRRGSQSSSSSSAQPELESDAPRFGMTAVCGRRRDMEDAVAIHPSFCQGHDETIPSSLHFYGVYDGHGCSHVAKKCKELMHEIVKSEAENGDASWKDLMTRSFTRMDKEVTDWCGTAAAASSSSCRCELRTPQCDAVGSTAVVSVVTPDKIIVSNCGDSRAVLCRNGRAIPLSVDHKPDRPDELVRIEEAGGRVIYWDGPRVLGVLAMSRAIGDSYLKPYVISEPEVTVTERTSEDECLILATDGLWDVVSNETACGVARMCLQSRNPPSPPRSPGNDVRLGEAGESSDKACFDASMLLTKLALARHSTDNVSVVVIDLKRGSVAGSRL